MRFRNVLSLATLFLVLFTVVAWSSPSSSQPTASLWNSAPENHSIAGKITAVSDTEFSVNVSQNQKADPMQFLIDGNTKVEGQLAVGSQATVEYRSEGEQYIAVHVVVAPASGMTP